MNPKSTILFVDDEPWLSLSLRMSLEAKGYNCVSCKDMSEGMAYLEKNPVSVLVTDIMMPGGVNYPSIDSQTAGFKFVEIAREKFRDTGIVCLSVIGDQEKIEWLKKRGAVYLRKGETPLSTAAKMIVGKATGSYSV